MRFVSSLLYTVGNFAAPPTSRKTWARKKKLNSVIRVEDVVELTSLTSEDVVHLNGKWAEVQEGKGADGRYRVWLRYRDGPGSHRQGDGSYRRIKECNVRKIPERDVG